MREPSDNRARSQANGEARPIEQGYDYKNRPVYVNTAYSTYKDPKYKKAVNSLFKSRQSLDNLANLKVRKQYYDSNGERVFLKAPWEE